MLVGFGAILPILPLYLVGHGIDNALLGVIIAAWPLAKLISEPIFGYLGDRRARKPIMLVALVILAVSIVLPLWLTSAPAFFVSRLIGGLATGMYDPAARGIIVDATDEDRRGEAFGLYGSFQMGGLILGPVIGSAAAAVVGGYAFPFVLTAALVLVAALFLAARLRDTRDLTRDHTGLARADHQPSPPSHLGPGGEEMATGLVGEAVLEAALNAAARPRGTVRPAAAGDRGRLLNRMLVAAVVMELTFAFSTGVYEVIWSLFMSSLGASVAWIGFTFTLFALPVMLLSPFAGRLVDRYGGLRFAILGGLAVAAAGLIYTTATEPVMPALVGLLEASGFAFVGPALFWLLARGTPPGRTSTAQGIFGAAGTTGTIVSSLAAGVLWGVDPRLPFYLFVGVSLVGMAVAAVIGRERPGAAPGTLGA